MFAPAILRFLFLSAATGCVICTFPGDEVCTEIAVPGVVVTVTDPAGQRVEGASLSVAGMGPRQACDDLGFGEYACGWEQSGLLTVFVEAEGFLPQVLDVEVEHDGCHPITVALPVLLEGDLVCTEEAVASVVLSFIDERGEAVPHVRASFSLDGEGERQACTSAGGTLICGVEQVGTVLVDVEAPGFEDALLQYEVAIDEAGCHPVTVFDEVVLAEECG